MNCARYMHTMHYTYEHIRMDVQRSMIYAGQIVGSVISRQSSQTCGALRCQPVQQQWYGLFAREPV